MKSNRKLLLASTALVAAGMALAGANGAMATSLNPAGATAGDATALTPAGGGADTLDTANDSKFAKVNVTGGATVASAAINNTGNTIYVYDGTNDAGPENLTVSGDVIIGNTAHTLTVVIGSNGTNNQTDATSTTGVVISGKLTGTAGARGGSVTFSGASNDGATATAAATTVSVAGNVALTNLSVGAGNGGDAEAGSAISATFGTNSSNTFNVTGLTVTSGNADDSVAKVGGDNLTLVKGTATIGASGITMTAGNGNSQAAGGAASLEFEQAATVSGAIAVTGGNSSNSHAAAVGGAAALQFDKGVSSTSTLAIRGGDATALGAGGNATVTLKGDATFTGITLRDGAANGGTAGAATLVVSGDQTGGQTITGTIQATGGAAAGTLTIGNNNATDTARLVTFASAIGGSATETGVSKINIGSATAQGLAQFNDTVRGGTITVTGGDASAEDSAATFKGNVTATTIALVGTDSGGDAAATFHGDVSSNITLNDGTAANATVTFGGSGTLQTVTGNITGTANATGTETININNNTKLVGALGGAGAGVEAVNIVNGKTFTIATNHAAIKAATVTLTGTGTLAIDTAVAAAADVTLTGAIAAASTSGDGTLQIGGTGGLTVTGDIGSTTNRVNAITVNGLATGKTVALNGNNYIGSISVNSTNSTDVNTITFGNGADTLNVSGNISSAQNGKHILNFVSSTAQTVTGNIGGSGVTFATANVQESLTAGGNVYVDDIAITNGKTLTLTGTSATVSGTIKGAGVDNQGTVTVGDGAASSNVTFSSAFGDVAAGTARNSIANLNVLGKATATFDSAIELGGALSIGQAGNGSTVTFKDAVKVAGNFTVDGDTTLNIKGGTTGSQAISVGGNTVLANTADKVSTINIGKTSTFNPSDLNASGTTTSADALIKTTGTTTVTGQVKVGLASDTVAIANGSTIWVASTGAGGTDLAAAIVTSASSLANGKILLVDTAMIDLQDTSSDATNLKVKVVYKTPDGASGNSAKTLTPALTAAANDATAFAALANLTSSQTQSAGEQLAPNSAAQANQATLSSTKGAFSAVSSRIEGTRVQTASAGATGVAAGDAGQRGAVWMKGFGSIQNQGARGGVAGYDSNTAGVAVGADRLVTNNIRLGLAGSYARTFVDGADSGKAETTIDSYQLTAYGSYEPGKYYVQGMAAYAYNRMDMSRNINFGGLSRHATGDTDGHQFSTKVEAGMPLNVASNMTVTPFTSLFYSHNSTGSFTETGAGALSLKVDSNSGNFLQSEFGSKLAYAHKGKDGVLTPELRAGLLYEYLGEKTATTASYTGGGAAFTTDGLKPAQLGAHVGLGVGFLPANSAWDVRADYDAEIRENFTGHSGMITARYNF